jgi:glyceraldehyde 3-phosphate dehydrogenase
MVFLYTMLPIGINGFGRIGKCVFLQLIHSKTLDLRVINAPDFDINQLEHYLKRDSVHNYNNDFTIEIIDDNQFKINNKTVHLLRNRDAKMLNWRSFGVHHIIDATGVYLTKEKAQQHDIDYIIMSAPPKDDTPLFVYGANHSEYNNEKIISNASCTTNSIVPVLKHLNDMYGIKQANFTTIHASTASQKVVDTAHSKSRTNRSILNNIIPHTTGASSSICKIIPELDGKIVGTSVRVPINNVSLIDLNVELVEKTDLDHIFNSIKQNPYLELNDENVVSSDLITTCCPSIIDKKASIELTNNQFKIMIWYDNEWSYASQIIKMMETIGCYNANEYFIDKRNFKGKNVYIRLDLNVPKSKNKVSDTFRITSAIPTIKRVLQDSPKRIVLMSHSGRPKESNSDDSLIHIKPILESLLNKDIEFLSHGLHSKTIEQMENSSNELFLLENLRFHPEETQYKTMGQTDAVNIFHQLGDSFVNDAFGCMHRDHLSICGSKLDDKCYGYLVDTELNALQTITSNHSNNKILAVIGGGKMEDKLKLLKNLSKQVDHIYIAGGNMNSIIKDDMVEYIQEISQNRAKITLMEDGLCCDNFVGTPKHVVVEELNEKDLFFDIGLKSLNTLRGLVEEHDVVFWNGTLGVVENEKYKYGSEMLVNFLIEAIHKNPHKKVIVGGGDTGGFVNKYRNNFTHISTGGGASIEYIINNGLVGLDVFTN